MTIDCQMSTANKIIAAENSTKQTKQITLGIIVIKPNHTVIKTDAA